MKARALLIDGSPGAWSSAQTILERALAVARNQGARSIELLVARELADLCGKQDGRDKARDLLSPICNWFTEGFDTAGLKKAKALLEELGVDP